MVKNQSGKNYFTIEELRDICKSLGISSVGLKHEMVERITSHSKNVESSDSDDGYIEKLSPISRMRISHTVTPLPALPLPPSNTHNGMRRTLFETARQWAPILLAAVSIGLCIGNFWLNWTTEYVSTAVRRSWFT